MQDAEASGVGTDVDQILRFININGFYVIGGKPVFPGVMYKLAGLRVVKVQAAIIGAYPKFLCLSSLIHPMMLLFSEFVLGMERMFWKRFLRGW